MQRRLCVLYINGYMLCVRTHAHPYSDSLGRSWSEIVSLAAQENSQAVSVGFAVVVLLVGLLVTYMFPAVLVGKFPRFEYEPHSRPTGYRLVFYKAKWLFYFLQGVSDIHKQEAEEAVDRVKAKQRLGRVMGPHVHTEDGMRANPFAPAPKVRARNPCCGGLLPATGGLRSGLLTLLDTKHWKVFAGVWVLFSVIMLGLDAPIRRDSAEIQDSFRSIESVIAVGYLCEMVLKMVAYGLVGDHRAYLTTPTTQLELLVVLAGVFNLAVRDVGSDADALRKVAKAFLGIRVLRVATLTKALRTTTQSIMRVVPTFATVLALAVVVYFIGAGTAVQLFKGRLRRCEDPVTLEVFADTNEGLCLAKVCAYILFIVELQYS